MAKKIRCSVHTLIPMYVTSRIYSHRASAVHVPVYSDHARGTDPESCEAAALTPRRMVKRADSLSEGPLTPSRMSSRLAALGAEQQLHLAPDGGVITRGK